MPGALPAASFTEVSAGTTHAMVALPDTLSRERHLELQGRQRTLPGRPGGVTVLPVVAILGLLNVFGQRPSTATADAPAARLQVYAPSHLRGGLLYMARTRVTANKDRKSH